MSFLSDIESWADKALKTVSDKNNQIVEDAFRQMVIRSPSPSNPGPYAKGLLVNQYYTTVGSGYSTEVGSSTSPTGIDSISRIQSVLLTNPFLGKDNIVSLSNSTPEAYHADVTGWEPGGGNNGWIWKGKAPYLMTTGTVNYIQNNQ